MAETKAFLRIEKLARGKIEGYEMWRNIPLSSETVLIGRPSMNPEDVVPDIKIVGDDYVTRSEHAEIYYSFADNCFILRDNHSTHGTFLNEEIIEKDRPYRLKDRDIIGLAKIGNEIRVEFRFRLTDETPPVLLDRARVPQTGLHINMASKSVYMNGQPVKLTKTELKLLVLLYENKGNACSIDKIAYEIWGTEAATEDLVAHYIRLLRKKIENDPSKPVLIVSIPGRHGCYRLEA